MELQNRQLIEELFGHNNWLYHHTPDWLIAMSNKMHWLNGVNERRKKQGLPPRKPGPDLDEYLQLSKGRDRFTGVTVRREWVKCVDCTKEVRVKETTLERRKKRGNENLCKSCRNCRRMRTMKEKQ